MGSFEPTPEQRRAMEDRGGSLLVSAAAGSGCGGFFVFAGIPKCR